MAKKLEPDYIKWVLTLNASQAQEEFHKLEKENKELQKQTNASRKAMADLEARGQKGSAAWNNLRKSIQQNNTAMAENRRKMAELEKQFDLSSMTVNQLRKRLKSLQSEFNNTSKAANPARYAELQQQIKRTQQALSEATGQTDKLKNSFLSLTQMKATILGFFAGIGMSMMNIITGSFKSAFNLVVDFEKANSNLAAILGTTRKGIKDMTAAARELGATTSYSAAEVTGLQVELAKLGFEKDQILAMEGGVLKFAKAVNTDLSSAAAFAGAALRIFGKDARDTEDVLATFAVATTKTALDFSKLETALSTVGPVAHSFGLSIEDTTALLGVLANAGFDASSAATATRNIILKLCDANGDLAKALGGPVRNIDDLAAGLQKLESEGINLAKVLELTDTRSVAAFSSFLDQADSLSELRMSITGVNDEFNQMSETMGDNVAGALAGLKSAAEELVLKIADGSEGPLKDFIKMLTSLVHALGSAYQYMSRFGGVIKLVVIAWGSYRLSILAAHTVQKLFFATVGAGRTLMTAFRATLTLCSTGFKTMTGNLKGATTSVNAFKTALASTPWGAIIGAITAVTATIVSLCSRTSEAAEKLKAKEEELTRQVEEHARKREEFNTNLAAQKQKLLDLLEVARDENAAENERLKAINALNRACPEFEGHLDEERKRLIANDAALKEYIKSMEKRMRLAYYKDEYEEYIKEEEAAKTRLIKAIKSHNEASENVMPGDEETVNAIRLGRSMGSLASFHTEAFRLDDNVNKAKEANAELNAALRNKSDASAALKEFKEIIEEAGFSLTEVLTFDENEAPLTPLTDNLDDVDNKLHSVVDEVKTLKKELKELRKADPQTDDEFARIEARKATIQQRIRELSGKNKSKSKRAPGTYAEDSIDEATAAADDVHQKNMLEINKQKGAISEADFIIKKNEELIRYSGDLVVALETLKKKTDETHTQTLDKITAEENKIAQRLLVAQQAINKATAQKAKEGHEQQLIALQAAYDTQEATVKRELIDREKTQGEAEVYLLAQQKALHEAQLKELNDYYAKTEKASYLGEEERRQMLDKINNDIRAMQSKVLTDTGNFAERVRELSTNTTGATGLKESFEFQRRNIEATYDEMLKHFEQGSETAVALEKEKNRRLAALDYEYQEQLYQLQELTGLTWGQEFDRELLKLENMHEQGLISEKNYQKARLVLQRDNVKKYFDYYAQLSGSMFSAIQEAEIATSDAKYDVLIQQAKNNGEDTAALEEEKENKKLEIQKKYADVNFAIKVSQIIADTAVAVIKTFAEFGYTPWGIAAAAMMSATGAAQIFTAKAERDKIKNMQPAKTANASSSQPAQAERVLSGYAEGGYTGDGGRYEVAGVVHRGEYVVPKPIMDNPRVIDAVSTIEAIRRNKRLASGAVPSFSEGYADGGPVGAAASPDVADLTEAVTELKAVVQALRLTRAYVVYQDIENAGAELDAARAPFTRKK